MQTLNCHLYKKFQEFLRNKTKITRLIFHFFSALVVSALWYYFGAIVKISFRHSRFGARDQLEKPTKLRCWAVRENYAKSSSIWNPKKLPHNEL